MPPKVSQCRFEQIEALQRNYLSELQGQCVHWSLHRRAGWVQWYACTVDDSTVGYGAVAVGGPWQGTRTLFEFFVAKELRPSVGALFGDVVAACRPTAVLFQTNDQLFAGLAQSAGAELRDEKVLFRDGFTTRLEVPGARVLPIAEIDSASILDHHVEPVGQWALVVAEEVVGTGGFLTHYNQPYCDLFMEVREDRRRQGLGGFLVQEIKRLAIQQGFVPCARCHTDDAASKSTLLRAGMAECGRIRQGVLTA